MKHSRVRAFTLIELVLAMMLAAIVMGMAYTAFTLFTRLYGGYRIKNLAHADVRVFKQVLERDMESAVLVTVGDGRLNFSAEKETGDLVYTFGSDYLLRIKNSVQDTFKMKGLKVGCAFEGLAITDGVADQVLIRFEYEKAPLVISVTKQYTSAELFNYPPIHQRSLWNQ